ncbi:protein terminal ear1-like [Forsythia ovata]|uniref:Protein terminal ear1-like n=1 Tax=Forsythia ovata TaxID=205694 RepID=A0ABD1VI18_9LAMI
MDNTGFHRFPGHLDPRAQEFFPTTTIPLLPLQIYYPQSSPPPYLLQEALLPYMGYPQQHFANPPPPLYLSLVEPQTLSVSLPPSSSSSTRTLLLSMVPTDISESTVRRELEVFGDVRAVQMEWLRKGMAYPFNAYPHSSTSSTGAWPYFRSSCVAPVYFSGDICPPRWKQ